jgi:hypothetical protein
MAVWDGIPKTALTRGMRRGTNFKMSFNPSQTPIASRKELKVVRSKPPVGGTSTVLREHLKMICNQI